MEAMVVLQGALDDPPLWDRPHPTALAQKSNFFHSFASWYTPGLTRSPTEEMDV
eukprot:CAMPEP_0172418486 /NCGR_PEP_ID=MMETSP1064-20121228/4964_1 /TAXON_ID=202472 /ORGANISM="Aulacoseira subarctica , Strain CCAP 1002/5" /LENGTH=53 /DNA_ID=CAMNT_0013157433 /DNA_START=99 /DNA_END=256 /DNA_ORIENTATION=+